MEMNPGALPRLGRMPAQEFWSPETWWRWRRRSELLLEKRVLDSGFPRREEYICEGGQPEAERGPTGAPSSQRARPPSWPRRQGAWAPLASSDAPLWHIFTPRPETLEDGTLFRDLISIPPPPRFQDREHQENSSRHPAGGEDHHRELLRRHGRLPDES